MSPEGQFVVSPDTAELRKVLSIGASALLFIYITLEVRHLFWGSDVTPVAHPRATGIVG